MSFREPPESSYQQRQDNWTKLEWMDWKKIVESCVSSDLQQRPSAQQLIVQLMALQVN